ncbi:MAG: hypothetical protein IKN07_03655 [Lachnospiraceae bacterium]|nr:hypothetical protein [Lachnospiraceae bacterium]
MLYAKDYPNNYSQNENCVSMRYDRSQRLQVLGLSLSRTTADMYWRR